MAQRLPLADEEDPELPEELPDNHYQPVIKSSASTLFPATSVETVEMAAELAEKNREYFE